MPSICDIDCETRSGLDISEVGVYAYAADPLYQLIIVTYSLDGGPVLTWFPIFDESMPPELLDATLDPGCIFRAHNANFELQTVNRELQVPVERWRCTMAQAYAHALPGALDTLGRFLGAPADKQKQADGKALIKLFCAPPFADPADHPEKWERFSEYARQDIIAMQFCARKMPCVNYPKMPSELALWRLDQKINDRGFAVDVQMAQVAMRRLAAEKKELNELIASITGGAVTKGTQNARLQTYLREQCGVDLPNMQKGTVAEAAAAASDDALTLLNIRRDIGRASTSKYERLLAGNVNGRMYGTAQFCGAGRTGRWAGRGFQPMNLPRPQLKADVVYAEIDALKRDLPPLVYVSEHDRCADALRGAIVAAPGKKLVVVDWSSIEGRLNAWSAGEAWVLNAYAEGRDVYIETYKSSYGVKEDIQKSDPRRQYGKVLDLSMGYEGGAGALLTGCKNARIDPAELSQAAMAIADTQILEGANWMWEWAKANGMTHGLDQVMFEGLQCAKLAWRRSRPRTVAMWRALRDALFDSLKNPGQVFRVAKTQMMCTGPTLAIKLPSGRMLLYYNPRISTIKTPPPDGEPDAEIKTRKAVTCASPHGGRQVLYGGKVAENEAQANSRDILADAMPRVEAAGFAIVGHTYDEIVAEVDEDSPLTHEDLERLVCIPPAWGKDIPLAAEGFTTTRYKKE